MEIRYEVGALRYNPPRIALPPKGALHISHSATRPVRRIFISSTAIDLRDYRDKVRDAILRLETLPIAMETFSANSGQPASECMRMAAEADAVICIVAHRYGYVPPKELGGDGERSITWLEVDAAKRAGKPVFAFLVDSKAPWTELKEQDRLTSEPSEKAAEIVKAVQKLKEFKTYLENQTTRNIFASDEELAKLVAITLAKFNPQPVRGVESTTRIWKPLFCHALQPAQHFRGRETKLQELKDWLQSPVTPDRVISVVAAGGTGKTALVDKALHEAKLSERAGVFVWSFYEDPYTDAFLRAAYLYFTGEKDTPTGGMLERLQIALSGDTPHVLVLDGLERVQGEGDHRRRGELEDLQLKRLLRALAGAGNTRALVTSRFPLVDLEGFTGAGHRAIVLDDLERSVALDVLRAWKVRGDDAELTKLIEPLDINGFCHALSVAVLGSYIGNFAEGDPTRAPDFSLEDAKESDPKARKLNRILEQYVKALTLAERDLLARLSLFPRGVEVELLAWIVQSGGEVAGALIGLRGQQLVEHLERLQALGLVFRYKSTGRFVYSAHPFLRDFFRNLLGTKPESVHESIRAKLAPSLEVRPTVPPADPSILDQYEMLIEETLLAGRVKEAFDLYRHGLGGYRNLMEILGENSRGLRILERFAPEDNFSQTEHHLSASDQVGLASNLALFAENLGHLNRAHAAHLYCWNLDERDPNNAYNVANIQTVEGNLREALEYADSSFALALEEENEYEIVFSLLLRARLNFILGDIATATTQFDQAAKLEHDPRQSWARVLEAECKLLQGDRSTALRIARACKESAGNIRDNDSVSRCSALIARLLDDAPTHAARILEEARIFANRSGRVELQLRCSHSASGLQLDLGDYPQAIAEAEAGILLADTCGFGKYSIDLRLVLAETLLAAGDARKALQNAREALDRSEHPDCQYAWGKADGLHFCGLAHLRLGERKLARQRLTAALELRERLGHGRIEETRRALQLCDS